MQIRQRHFGGRNQIVIALESQLEQIGFKFRKLSRAEERVVIDDERRQHLSITVLGRVQVEHEIDQRAFELRAEAGQNRKTRACNLRRALLIENAEGHAEINVIFRLEAFSRKIARRSPAAYFRVRRFIFADRNRFVRQVRHADQNRAELVFKLIELDLDSLRLLGDGARFGLLRFGFIFFTFAHQRADLFADAVAGGVQFVAFANQRAAHAVKLGEIVERRRIEIAGAKFFAHEIKILPHKMNIKHNQSSQAKNTARAGNSRQYASRRNVSRREISRLRAL
ncbi:MAG: hypothetical protein JMDDDDMK_03643 [Acidobacteria bacterium]|nr:hypothetical protein [Acidobacteriota bacterium]